MSNTRKLISILLIFLVLVIAYLFLDINKSNKVQGTVVSVNPSSVVIRGAYDSEIANAKALYNFEVALDKNTKYTKTSFFIPFGDESFNVDDLTKDIQSVDYSTMKKDSENVALGIEVTLDSSFFGRFTKKAVEVKYIGPKY